MNFNRCVICWESSGHCEHTYLEQEKYLMDLKHGKQPLDELKAEPEKDFEPVEYKSNEEDSVFTLQTFSGEWLSVKQLTDLYTDLLACYNITKNKLAEAKAEIARLKETGHSICRSCGDDCLLGDKYCSDCGEQEPTEQPPEKMVCSGCGQPQDEFGGWSIDKVYGKIYKDRHNKQDPNNIDCVIECGHAIPKSKYNKKKK